MTHTDYGGVASVALLLPSRSDRRERERESPALARTHSQKNKNSLLAGVGLIARRVVAAIASGDQEGDEEEGKGEGKEREEKNPRSVLFSDTFRSAIVFF